ncbi:hypothetical protein MQA00_22360, partial [Escherichia coli]|nr:hypothetical protein [Escherichia coli]
HQPNRRLRLAAEPQTGRREVSALTDARKTLAYDFFRILRAPLLERLLSGKRMTGRDEMDIKRILKTKEALDNIRNFIDKQQLTNSDTPKKSTVPNEDKKGIR